MWNSIRVQSPSWWVPSPPIISDQGEAIGVTCLGRDTVGESCGWIKFPALSAIFPAGFCTLKQLRRSLTMSYARSSNSLFMQCSGYRRRPDHFITTDFQSALSEDHHQRTEAGLNPFGNGSWPATGYLGRDSHPKAHSQRTPICDV